MPRGHVKWWKDEKGYGFITGDDGREFFVHYTHIQKQGIRTLHEGERVCFDEKDGDKGPHAINVESIDDTIVDSFVPTNIQYARQSPALQPAPQTQQSPVHEVELINTKGKGEMVIGVLIALLGFVVTSQNHEIGVLLILAGALIFIAGQLIRWFYKA